MVGGDIRGNTSLPGLLAPAPPARGFAQYISKKRPSGFVIPSLRSELALERSEGMTLLKRLRLTRKTSSLKWIAPCGRQVSAHDKREKTMMIDLKQFEVWFVHTLSYAALMRRQPFKFQVW